MNILSSAKMDFTLLALDMQRFLRISSGTKSFNDIRRQMPSDSHLDSTKVKLRHSAELEDILVHKCCLCPSYFNSKELLAKHVLRIHNKAVVMLLQEGSTEHHLKCRFCVHKVMHRHQKLLLLHLEKKHALELVSFLDQLSKSPRPKNFIQKREVSVDHSTSGFPKNGFCNVPVSSCVVQREAIDEPCTKAIVSSSTNNSFVSSDILSCKPKVFEPNESKNFSQCAKRKLNLDGTTTCRSNKAFIMKENVPPPSNESLSITLAKSGWKRAPGNHFACGRCKEAFSCNALLLDHVSVRHRGPLRLLQPLFTCGLCSASFYRNSFLVRHCFQHHTPK